MAAPSIYHRGEDGVKISAHVDCHLVVSPEMPIRALFEWLGQRIAVKGLETFDPVRGLKFLGMVYYSMPGGYPETTPSRYIEGMASMIGVLRAKTPTTPGIRTKHPTEADEKPVDAARCRAIVGKAPMDPQSSARRPVRRQGAQPTRMSTTAKRMVKSWHSQHCVGASPAQVSAASGQRLRQRPSKLPEVLLGSDGVAKRCTREFALTDERLIALSPSEAEYDACTVGVSEVKFVQSLLLDWRVSGEIENFVDNSRQQQRHHARGADWPRRPATHGAQILVGTGRIQEIWRAMVSGNGTHGMNRTRISNRSNINSNRCFQQMLQGQISVEPHRGDAVRLGETDSETVVV